jgi:4-amino-4-deoxy-L-arabinose transferase-like glycosyltransferase
MPGLPLIIGIGQTLTGDSRLGIAVIHGVLYAGLVVFAARLATTTFGKDAGVWAAAGVGLNPALGYYAAQALTEFLTGCVLLGLAATVFTLSRTRQLRYAALAGLLIASAGYLRSEYLGLTVFFAAIVFWLGRSNRARALGAAALLVGVTVAAMAPWVARYTIVTGRPALYNESPFSNLFLMGTFFRVFDEQTFAELQRIETAPGPREDAIQKASSVGPRPELSRRYMEQARGPYERPLGETLDLAFGTIRLNASQYVVNHALLAPVLIWIGHTPVRQADAPRLPTSARYAIWGGELLLLLLAVWQAVAALRGPAAAFALSFLAIALFLTLVHIVLAVDDRFTTPALPLVGLFGGARIAQLLHARQRLALRYAA